MTVAKSGPANRERVYGIDPRGRAFEVQIDVGCYSGRQILAMRASSVSGTGDLSLG